MLFTINKYMLLFLCFLFIKEKVKKKTVLKKQLNFF